MRNISHKVEEKEEVVMGEAVGKDLYSSFQQQEFTDFEIVCEDRNLQCHKVVLAARSPVFRLVRDLNASSNLDIGSPGFLQGNAVEWHGGEHEGKGWTQGVQLPDHVHAPQVPLHWNHWTGGAQYLLEGKKMDFEISLLWM